MLYSIDIDYRAINEKIVHEKLKLFFPNEIINELDYYNEFDYTNEDNSLFIELNSRRCGFNEYNDTMSNISKLNKCKRLTRCKSKSINIYFIFTLITMIYITGNTIILMIYDTL